MSTSPTLLLDDTPDSHGSRQSETQSTLSAQTSNAQVAHTPIAGAQVPPARAAPAQIGRPTLSAPLAMVPVSPRRWPRIVGFSLLGLLIAAGGAVYGTYASWRSGEHIAPGLVIQGESIGGLTQQQARERLSKRFGRLFVTFETPQRPYKMALRELGGQPQITRAVQNAYWLGRNGNIISNLSALYNTRQNERRLPLGVKWEKNAMRRKMWTVAADYNRAPRDARLAVGESGVRVIAHQTGRALNVGATLHQLQEKYFVGRPEIEATVKKTLPRLVSADLAGRDMKLGEYPTYFNSGLWGRTRNIHVAAGKIDGKVLMPGEEFSFNKSTGERTWDKGYRMAHIFERKPGQDKAEVVDGLAGGVCQVSSTLYNAVRFTNKHTDGRLKIVERNYHSLPVTYVPTGRDATVAWPHKDFRFRNTFAHPIFLRADVDGSKLLISVWGRVPEKVSDITVPADETLDAGIDSQRQARAY